MKLTEMLSALSSEIQDEEANADALTRAVVKTVSLMSRLLPKRNVVESRILGDVTSETLAIASNMGTLAVHPIKVGTVLITGKTEGTHFSVNHLTGVVTEIGSGLPDGNYTVSYSRDPRAFDIAALVSDCIKIERIEYPAGQEPPVNPTFEHIGDFLFFKGKDFSLSEDYYLRAIYLSAWTPPSIDADSDYPSHLDNAVIIGSAGQYLIFRAEYYVLQAASILSDITAPTAPTAPTLSFLDFDSAIGAVGDEITAAKAHHTSGATVINAATRGSDVAATYGRYAEAVYGGANTRVNEALAQLRKQEDILQKYASEVTAFGSEVYSYATEVQEAQMRASQYMDIAGRCLASGQAKINEFLIMIGAIRPEYPTTKLLSEGAA